MKTFFVSKYPVDVGYEKENSKKITAPVGTIFTITCINGDFFGLMPIKKIPNMISATMVSSGVLSLGFTEQDHI